MSRESARQTFMGLNPDAYENGLTGDVRNLALKYYSKIQSRDSQQFHGNYKLLATCCIKIACEQKGSTFDVSLWNNGADPAIVTRTTKAVRKLLGIDSATPSKSKSKTKAGSSSPVKPASPAVTPSKRPGPEASASSSKRRRTVIEPPSADKRAAELEVPIAPTSTPKRTADVTPQSTPSKATPSRSQPPRGRAPILRKPTPEADEAMELVLPARFVTPVGEPHDYELDPAYGGEERRAACRDWRSRTIEALRNRQEAIFEN